MQITAIIFVTGIACAIGLIIYTIRQRHRLTTAHNLLALSSLILPTVGLMMISMEQQPRRLSGVLRQLGIEVNPLEVLLHELAQGSIDTVIQQLGRSPAVTAQLLIWLVAIILIIGGSILWFLARRSAPQNRQTNALGILVTGVGILLLVVPFSVRAASGILRDTTPSVQSVSTAELTTTVIPEVANFVTNTPIPVKTTHLSKQALSTMVMTSLPTRFVYATPTSSPTLSIAKAAHCTAMVQNNLNFRSGPGVNKTLLATIPHSMRLDVYAQSTDGAWLYVQYGNNLGWVSSQYMLLTSDCEPLPVQAN